MQTRWLFSSRASGTISLSDCGNMTLDRKLEDTALGTPLEATEVHFTSTAKIPPSHPKCIFAGLSYIQL